MTTEAGRLVSEAVVREIEREHVQQGVLCAACSAPALSGRGIFNPGAPKITWPCPPAQMAREIRRLWAAFP